MPTRPYPPDQIRLRDSNAGREVISTARPRGSPPPASEAFSPREGGGSAGRGQGWGRFARFQYVVDVRRFTARMTTPLALMHFEKNAPRTHAPTQNAGGAPEKLHIPLYGFARMASKAALMRRKSVDERSLRSRSAGLVISKAHGMPPIVERDVISAPVRPPPLCDGRALCRRRLLVAYPAQPKVKLQRIAHDG